MDLGISDKVAVVTGASKGIGAATVLGLAAEGARVACCARGADALEQLKKDAAPLPGSVHTWPRDLTAGGQLESFFEEVRGSLGEVDILVNNLGASPSRNFLYMKEDDWESGLNVNLLVAVRSTQLVLAAMRKKKWEVAGLVGEVASGVVGFLAFGVGQALGGGPTTDAGGDASGSAVENGQGPVLHPAFCGRVALCEERTTPRPRGIRVRGRSRQGRSGPPLGGRPRR